MKTKPKTEQEIIVSLGEILRQTRKEQQLSLKKVAQSLNIGTEHLESLEKDAFNNLPEAVYSIGFFRAYIKFLGLTNPDLVPQFKKEFLQAQQNPPALSLQVIYPSTAPSQKILWISILGAVLIALFFLYKSHKPAPVSIALPEAVIAAADATLVDQEQDEGEDTL